MTTARTRKRTPRAPQPEPDGPLTLARNQLEDAITALTHPQPTLHNHTVVHLDSRYRQLRQAMDISGSRGGGGNTGNGPTPCWMDALKLIIDIDQQTAQWDPTPTTPQRLNKVMHHPWRPQDCDHMNTITNEIRKWIKAIDDLFAPKPLILFDRDIKGTWATCDICGHRDAFKLNDEGHRIRVPALVIFVTDPSKPIETGQGLCQRCHTTWPAGLLCRRLGYEPQEIPA